MYKLQIFNSLLIRNNNLMKRLAKTNNIQQLGKKRTSPSNCAIVAFFGGPQTFKKMMMFNNNF
jgi:hypothetical protein